MEILLKDTDKIREYTKAWLLKESEHDYPDSIDIISEYWKAAKNIRQFKEMVFNDERLIYNKGYAQLSKEHQRHHEYRIEKIAEQFEHDIICSDSIVIKSTRLSITIRNGYTKKKTHLVFVGKEDKINFAMFRHLLDIEGKFDIINLENLTNTTPPKRLKKIKQKLDGKYKIASGYGFIFICEQ